MRSHFFVFMLTTFMLLYSNVLSENSFIQDNSLCFNRWSADSFVWDDNYLYIAHGIWTEDAGDSWKPDSYQILELDKNRSQFVEKLTVPYGAPLFIKQNEGNLYIIRTNIYNPGDESFSQFIIYDAIDMNTLFFCSR